MTSYPVLAMALVMMGLVLLSAAWGARAATVTASGNVNVSLIVPGPPPTTGAAFTGLTDGRRLTSSPINVSGTCQADLLVKVYKNGILAGSTFCTSLGTFTVPIDLLLGRNDLTAKNFDLLDQPGPDTPVVTVYYEPPAGGGGETTTITPLGTRPTVTQVTTPTRPEEQLVLTTDYLFKSIKPNASFSWDLAVSGGEAPYALSINWGDGQTSVVSAKQAGKLKLEHTYLSAGRYKITIRSSDAAGHTAYLELSALVDGVVPTLVGPIDTSTTNGQFYARAVGLLPVFAMAAGLVAAFWIGEKYAMHAALKQLSTRSQRKA